MDESKTMFIDNLGDIEIGASKDASQLDYLTAIDVSNDFAFVMLLIQYFFEAVIRTCREKPRLRSNTHVTLLR